MKIKMIELKKKLANKIAAELANDSRSEYEKIIHAYIAGWNTATQWQPISTCPQDIPVLFSSEDGEYQYKGILNESGQIWVLKPDSGGVYKYYCSVEDKYLTMWCFIPGVNKSNNLQKKES